MTLTVEPLERMAKGAKMCIAIFTFAAPFLILGFMSFGFIFPLMSLPELAYLSEREREKERDRERQTDTDRQTDRDKEKYCWFPCFYLIKINYTVIIFSSEMLIQSCLVFVL